MRFPNLSYACRNFVGVFFGVYFANRARNRDPRANKMFAAHRRRPKIVWRRVCVCVRVRVLVCVRVRVLGSDLSKTRPWKFRYFLLAWGCKVFVDIHRRKRTPKSCGQGGKFSLKQSKKNNFACGRLNSVRASAAPPGAGEVRDRLSSSSCVDPCNFSEKLARMRGLRPF